MPKFIILITLSLFALQGQAQKYQETQFKNSRKSVATIWSSIPFFEGGDLGQYQKTMSQDRDSVRKAFWKELMEELQQLSKSGVMVEMMLEPMANVLLKFDTLHDKHKAIDGAKINDSVENRFKASFDSFFQKYDVRDNSRRVQISRGTEPQLLESKIRKISTSNPQGQKMTLSELNVKYALEIYEQLDYLSYGTYSSQGNGFFTVTYTLIGFKSGVTRNFKAEGRIVEAIDSVAFQVFEYFQKMESPEWKNPHLQLQWITQPVNPTKEGYTFSEAKIYCQSQQARLPYYREILIAESGTAYKPGGLRSFRHGDLVAVADKRETLSNLFIRLGSEAATGGAYANDTAGLKGQVVCVRGEASDTIKFYEKLMGLFRKYRGKEDAIEIFRAIYTIRHAVSDMGVTDSQFENIGGKVISLKLMSSVDEAQEILQKNKIELKIPEGLL